MSSPAKRMRRENAIERLKESIASHEANTQLTSKILEDKGIFKMEDDEIDEILEEYELPKISKITYEEISKDDKKIYVLIRQPRSVLNFLNVTLNQINSRQIIIICRQS